jgi:uncharacterized protein
MQGTDLGATGELAEFVPTYWFRCLGGSRARPPVGLRRGSYWSVTSAHEVRGLSREGRWALMSRPGCDGSTQALPPEQARRLSSAANDTAIAAVNKHPMRFQVLSTLPMSSPEHVADELVRAKGLGHVGAMVYGRSGDRVLDDPAYEEFFAAAAELSQPVFIHPQIPSDALRDASYRGFGELTDLALATFGWGWHLDTATAALRLILRGTFDRHPALQVVLGHWGEMLLFWLDRADRLARVAGLQRSVSDYIRANFYITASGMLNPALLHHALSVTTIDRLIFSTDYPFQQPTQVEINSFLGHFASDEDRHKFSSANAAALYDLELGSGRLSDLRVSTPTSQQT